MILTEYFVCQVTGGSLQVARQGGSLRNLVDFMNRLFCCNAEYRYQQINVCKGCCLVDAYTYIAVIEIAEINFLTQSNRAELLC